MRGELVAIDLETTGLDHTQDEIIEIGAVRFKDGVIVDEFSTLIDPGRSLPTLITSLTGLRDDDLVGTPKIQDVLPQLLAFVGHSPWMAHNVSFDASFLNSRAFCKTTCASTPTNWRRCCCRARRAIT